MYHVMFDIDGTLVETSDLDSECFAKAVEDVLGIKINLDWTAYTHVTDGGILHEILESNEVPEKQAIFSEVKSVFIQKIKDRVNRIPVVEIPGASSFLSFLNSRNDVVVSIATGGWFESASLKLRSAGIQFEGIPLASSDDSFDRTEIMNIAADRAGVSKSYSCVYFGDGEWDKIASQKLGYHFVLVGEKLKHNPNIINFNSIKEAAACIGL